MWHPTPSPPRRAGSKRFWNGDVEPSQCAWPANTSEKKRCDAHILIGYKVERSYTKGYEASAHIPDGYEAKTLIQSRTLTYRRLRGEELANIPKATKRRHSNTIIPTRRSTFPQPKGVENSSPKTSKCQIDEKCRKRLLASFSKAPRTTHNGDPTSWESSRRRTAPGQWPEDRNQRKSPSERRS